MEKIILFVILNTIMRSDLYVIKDTDAKTRWSINEHKEDGYFYGFETDNGIRFVEKAIFSEHPFKLVAGYVAHIRQLTMYETYYVVDESGFHPIVETSIASRGLLPHFDYDKFSEYPLNVNRTRVSELREFIITNVKQLVM